MLKEDGEGVLFTEPDQSNLSWEMLTFYLCYPLTLLTTFDRDMNHPQAPGKNHHLKAGARGALG